MKKIIGLGNALVDIMTKLENDELLHSFDLPKGGMQLVDNPTAEKILTAASSLSKQLSSGGSAANTIHGLARLGMQVAFIGKIGKDDYGDFFKKDMANSGITPVLLEGKANTGLAVALISNDSERTFATYLGAAIEMIPSELTPEMFSGYSIFHIEGYLVQNQELVEKSMKLAKENGLLVSLDLASYNVVEANLEFLKNISEKYVDILFANEEESKAFTGEAPEQALEIMANYCDIAVVKVGAKGSLIKSNGINYQVPSRTVKPVDTTGAGDLYASGFLFGMSKNYSPDICAKFGTILATEVIVGIGAKIPDQRWEVLRNEIK